MIKLILSNIRKHIFLFSLLGIMIFIFTLYLVVAINILLSVKNSLENSAIQSLTSDVIIIPEKKKHIDIITMDGEKKVETLPSWQKLWNFLKSKDYVVSASPRLRKWAYIKSEHNDAYMILVGVDPESEKLLLPGRKLFAGLWLCNLSDAMMYYRHSDYLYLTQGEILGIGLQNLDGYINFDTVRLTGLLDYVNMEIYSEFALYCFVHLDFLNQLLGTTEPVASEIWVKLKDKSYKKTLIHEVEKEFGKQYKFIFPLASASLLSGISSITSIVIIGVLIVLLTLIYACGSFLIYLSIDSRLQEIGIYHAMGVKVHRIATLLGGEFMIVILTFSIMGVVSGNFLTSLMEKSGIEANIIPLQFIFGAQRLTIQGHSSTLLITLLIILMMIFSNILMIIRKLRQISSVEILREL
ncbi:MAG: FtsX-like permease family protein [Brevinematia bacterium]